MLSTYQESNTKILLITRVEHCVNNRIAFYLVGSMSPIKTLILSQILIFQGAQKSIMTQASTTRRSAGIPVLMASLMLAMSTEVSLEDLISILIRQAQVPVSPQTDTISDLRVLPQVHTLNSIRQAFKTSSLRNRLDASVDSCLELAAECFGSAV
jgi:hypothetical protein